MKKLLVSLLMGCLVLGMVACGSNADNAPQDGGNDTVVETPVDTEPATEPETEAVTEPETEVATEPETEPETEVVEKEEPEKQEVAVTPQPAPQPAPAPVEPTPVAPVEPEVVLEKSPWVIWGEPQYDANTDSMIYFYTPGNDAHHYYYYLYVCELLTANNGRTGEYYSVSHPMGTYQEGEVFMAQVFVK